MKPPLTLALFAAGLAVVFGASAAVGAAVGPVGPAAPVEQPVDHGRSATHGP